MQVGEETLEDGSTKEFLISGSRDKSVMTWEIQERGDTDQDKEWGIPKKILHGIYECVYYLGHSHFINDLTLS